jgi:hypothetical protein
MAFGLDGLLYFGTGDKFTGAAVSQNMSSGGGKLHRIRSDGSIPPDNMGMDDGVGGASLDSMYAMPTKFAKQQRCCCVERVRGLCLQGCCCCCWRWEGTVKTTDGDDCGACW